MTWPIAGCLKEVAAILSGTVVTSQWQMCYLYLSVCYPMCTLPVCLYMCHL